MRHGYASPCLAAAVVLSCVAYVVADPLPAFPGAEGAGRFSTGGRGGDVYYVTTLADAGPGSLRHGINSASGPRTILFNVSGTIDLASNLDISKPNLTIAGQSAPGGGITLAGRQTRIANTHDVVLQFLRFRVGDTHTRDADSTYEPDALWIAGSSNVMIDHVSTSWGVDEVLSVSHGSTNVTVQWSTITEALHDAGHHKGNHGYGSIFQGGDVSLLRNLYANNRSRNPAVGGPGGGNLNVLNNVIANPGGRFSYSGNGDSYAMNFVGNYGIAGPNTTVTNELFHGDSTGAQIHYAGNYLDQDKDGILDGTPAGPSTLTGTHTPLPSPIPAPGTFQTDATQAYIQVLSRAGASYYRDPVDRRVIRNVMNQTGTHLDSQDEVGGWPILPTAPPPADSNGDGVPDAYAIAHGLDVNANIGSQGASNGYTHLQNYLHSLVTHTYAPTTPTSNLTVSTADGHGGDAGVSENRVSGVTNSSGTTGPALSARWNGGGNADRNEYIVLKFDLSDFEPGSITGARLDLTAFSALAGTHQLRVYGLEHDAAGWDWDENTVAFAAAPGLEYDGDSATRGLDADRVLTLGTIDASGVAAGDLITFDNPHLAVFLNLAAHFRGEEQDGIITLILERTNSGNGQTRFASWEATSLNNGLNPLNATEPGLYAPRLLISGTPVPEPTSLAAVSLGGFGLSARMRRGVL